MKHKIIEWSPDWRFLSEPNRYKVRTQDGLEGYLHVWYDVSDSKIYVTLRLPGSAEGIPESQLELPADLKLKVSKSIPAFRIRYVTQIIACICMVVFVVLIALLWFYNGVKYVIGNPRQVITTVIMLVGSVTAFVILWKLTNAFRHKRIRDYLYQFDSLTAHSTTISMPSIASIQLGEMFSSAAARLGTLCCDRKEHPEFKNVVVLNISPKFLQNPVASTLQVWTLEDRVFEIRLFLRESGDKHFDMLKQHLSDIYGKPEEDDPADCLFGFGRRERKFHTDAGGRPVTIHLFQCDPERELTMNHLFISRPAFLYVSYIYDEVWEQVHGCPPRISWVDSDQGEA